MPKENLEKIQKDIKFTPQADPRHRESTAMEKPKQ